MKHIPVSKPGSPYLRRPLRTVEAVEYERAALVDFISDCRASADREDSVFEAWCGQKFYALLCKQLQRPGTHTDAVDRVLEEDLPELCRELEEGAATEAREEAAHERYCRTMVSKGKGW